MTRRFVSQLNVGENIDQIFLVRSVRELKTRTDKRYLDLELSDRSGTIGAKIWDGVEKVLGTFQTEDYVKVRGQVTEYKGQLQITVSSVIKAKDEDVNESEMLPHTDKDPAELLGRLKEVLTTGVTEPNLRRLISMFLDDAGFMASFKRSPAATTFHHAYIGGLLEHTVSLLNLALRILPEYPALDKNLLLAAVFFHDIGKTVEMSGTRGFYFTDEGKMMGHVYMGAEMIETRARTLAGFPHQLLTLLKHMVLSHHGTREWGSPVLPCTMEAIALHYLDNLDAKMNAFITETGNIRDPKRRWSDWSRMFERELFRGTITEPRA